MTKIPRYHYKIFWRKDAPIPGTVYCHEMKSPHSVLEMGIIQGKWLADHPDKRILYIEYVGYDIVQEDFTGNPKRITPEGVMI
jgi:glutathionylspermidine synthase